VSRADNQRLARLSGLARLGRAIDRHVMAPAPAERLGALRVLVGGFAMVYFVARLPHLISYAHFDAAHFKPVGVVGLALSRPLPGWAVIALACAAAALSIVFFLGWRTRVVGPLFAALCLWTLSYRNSFGMIFHTENLLVIQVMILGLSRSGDAWSLDARRAPPAWATRPEGHSAYGWPIKLMCWVLVIAYVLAGVAKLKNTGLGWMYGDDMRNHVALDNARKLLLGDIHSPLAAPLMHWKYMWQVLATLTVIAELGAPVALLSVRAAAVWVLVVMSFHWGVLLLMMIVFPYQMTGVAFACFFPVERLLDRVHGRWQRRRHRRRAELDAATTG
jgi:hypothetical protein